VYQVSSQGPISYPLFSRQNTPGCGNGQFAARRLVEPVSLRWSISPIGTFAPDGCVYPTHLMHANTVQQPVWRGRITGAETVACVVTGGRVQYGLGVRCNVSHPETPKHPKKIRLARSARAPDRGAPAARTPTLHFPPITSFYDRFCEPNRIPGLASAKSERPMFDRTDFTFQARSRPHASACSGDSSTSQMHSAHTSSIETLVTSRRVDGGRGLPGDSGYW
jgi:hypothetical protein